MSLNAGKLICTLFCICITFHIGLAQKNPANFRKDSGKVFSFGVVTDIQYADAEKKGNRDYRNSLGKLETCVNEFNGHDLAFVVNLGDLIDHGFNSYEKPLAILDKLKAPLYNGTQLWNNREVLKLINGHPSVAAWIAGHHHAGGYERAGSIHHLTLKGMVEARTETSFGIVDVFPDKLVLKGYGDQNDQCLEISR